MHGLRTEENSNKTLDFAAESVGSHLKGLAASGTMVAQSHRAMFKLGGKKLFVLCLLVMNMSAVYSADR